MAERANSRNQSFPHPYEGAMTSIGERPPRRSRRALLTHRAPPWVGRWAISGAERARPPRPLRGLGVGRAGNADVDGPLARSRPQVVRNARAAEGRSSTRIYPDFARWRADLACKPARQGRGRDFIFTRCTASCPVLTPMMSLVQNRLGRDFGSRIVFASVTVDPEHCEQTA
jgi:hypothetical protein